MATCWLLLAWHQPRNGESPLGSEEDLKGFDERERFGECLFKLPEEETSVMSGLASQMDTYQELSLHQGHGRACSHCSEILSIPRASLRLLPSFTFNPWKLSSSELNNSLLRRRRDIRKEPQIKESRFTSVPQTGGCQPSRPRRRRGDVKDSCVGATTTRLVHTAYQLTCPPRNRRLKRGRKTPTPRAAHADLPNHTADNCNPPPPPAFIKKAHNRVQAPGKKRRGERWSRQVEPSAFDGRGGGDVCISRIHSGAHKRRPLHWRRC